jgi:hypothetical protein
VDDALATTLDAQERGLLAGLVLLHAGQAIGEGPWSPALARLRALDEEARGSEVAALLRDLAPPVASGLTASPPPPGMLPAGPLGADMMARSEADLMVELTHRGARLVGQSLAGAPLELRAHAMAAAGAPWASEIASAALGTHGEARERARTLVARAARLLSADSTPEFRLRAVGTLGLAALLARESPRSLAAVATRLPQPLARILLAARE